MGFICTNIILFIQYLCQIIAHHHHKHQGLDPVIRSVSRVTTAPANVSSDFQLYTCTCNHKCYFVMLLPHVSAPVGQLKAGHLQRNKS
jgi:hypothetical protein